MISYISDTLHLTLIMQMIPFICQYHSLQRLTLSELSLVLLDLIYSSNSVLFFFLTTCFCAVFHDLSEYILHFFTLCTYSFLYVHHALRDLSLCFAQFVSFVSFVQLYVY